MGTSCSSRMIVKMDYKVFFESSASFFLRLDSCVVTNPVHMSPKGPLTGQEGEEDVQTPEITNITNNLKSQCYLLAKKESNYRVNLC